MFRTNSSDMKKKISIFMTVVTVLTAMLTGCGSSSKTIDIQFSEKLPEISAIQEEINMLTYIIAEPDVTYKMKATYTTLDGESGEYMTYGSGGLSFKPEYLGKAKIEITASKEGKKDKELAHEIEITNGEPRVTGKDLKKIFFVDDTVTMDELLEYITIVPRRTVKTTFTKVTFNGKEVDLTGKSEFTFTECSPETTFHFRCENDGGVLEDTYTVKVTPYQNEAEKDDLVNYVDTTEQSSMAIVDYSLEPSPLGKGSFSYKFQADAACTWDNEKQTWLSYVFIDFPESFDRTEYYLTFDAKRSEDSFGAIVLHYLVGMVQQGPMSIDIPANEWTECSTATYAPEATHADNTKYTGVCFIILHKQGDKNYDPNNVWNLIDNLQLKAYPKTNAYEKQDLTNNMADTIQDGKITFDYSDEVSEVYDDPSKKGTYSYKLEVDPSCVIGSANAGLSYVFIDMPFDASKEHPVFDFKRSKDCDGNIIVGFVNNKQTRAVSTHYTEAGKWNVVDTSNFWMNEGETDTKFDGIVLMIKHPDKPTSQYNVNNVNALIDNLRLEENWF